MANVRLVCDYDAGVARLFVNTSPPEWIPCETEIILRSPEDASKFSEYLKNLSEEEEDWLAWFWYDMGYVPKIETG